MARTMCTAVLRGPYATRMIAHTFPKPKHKPKRTRTKSEHKAGALATSTRPAIPKYGPILDPILAAQANLTCPILNLPAEIITLIVLRHLHPREAIFLSLSCRQLHYGILSANNYFLWYTVGGFQKQLPGYKAQWLELAKSAKAPEPLVVKKGKKRVATEELASLESTKKPRSVPKRSIKQLVDAVKHYSADAAVIDYKGLLVETMLGDADTGCQWCLERPKTKKIYPSWGVRLCQECFLDNVVSVSACKPLNLDISHLPVQDGAVHGIWKPSVQRIINTLSQTITPEQNSAKHKDLIPPPPHPTLLPTTVAHILSEHKASVARAKSAKLALRTQHFDTIFTSIKRKYTDMFNAASATSFRGGDMWSRVMEKLPPDMLKQEWFIESNMSAPPHSRLLHNDQYLAWVDSWADKQLTRMQEVLTFRSEPGVIPAKMCYQTGEANIESLIDGVEQICKQWHLERLQSFDSVGITELFTTRLEEKGRFHCPWSSCYYGNTPITTTSSQHIYKTVFPSLQRFLKHIEMYHREILIVGDLDWLLGRPSRWWLRNLDQGESISGRTKEDEKNGAEWFREDLQQELWLREWWGEKWGEEEEREELRRVLGGWREDGGFWGYSRKLCRCRETIDRQQVYSYALQKCLTNGCRSC